jgi:hypothetical protein
VRSGARLADLVLERGLLWVQAVLPLAPAPGRRVDAGGR